jgi:hypothetical protein
VVFGGVELVRRMLFDLLPGFMCDCEIRHGQGFTREQGLACYPTTRCMRLVWITELTTRYPSC